MAAAYEEFHARLEELERTVNFTAASASLRPRLGDALKWEVGGEAIQLAVSFMSAKVTVEDIYAALLVRAVASFEHFARVLVEEAARHTAASGKSYAELGEHVNVRHTVLTGRLLSALEELPEYQTIDVEQIVNNLASCISGRSGFRLNTSAFSAVVTSPKPGVIERALANLGISGWWDAVGNATNLQLLLGTKRSRDTSKAASKRLEDLCKRRNKIAHTGDGDVPVTESELRQEIQFVRALGEALSREVATRFS